jgi:hypothetical protein
MELRLAVGVAALRASSAVANYPVVAMLQPPIQEAKKFVRVMPSSCARLIVA